MAGKLLFFGNERLATGVETDAPVLRALIDAGYEVAALVVAQRSQGSSRKPRPVEVVQVALDNSISVVAPDSLKTPETASELASYGAEAAVLVAYGKIVPQSIIDLFPHGIINIHPSLLPKHRGSTPIESAILDGDARTGVSLMQLVAAMDAGPVYAQEVVELSGHETKPELTAQLSALGAQMLISNLPAILDGSLQPVAQDESEATIDARISKEDAVLDFSKSAVQLDRQVRAHLGWPRSKVKIGSHDLIITKAHAIEDVAGSGLDGLGEAGELFVQDSRFGFYCASGALIIDEVQPAGKKPMLAADFLRGYSVS